MQPRAVPDQAAVASGAASVALFRASVLLSASLLFGVQPMFAKMILPKLGGTPATWNACLLFFQVALLLGYLYVHFISTRLNARAQVVLHVALLLMTATVFPMVVPLGSPSSHSDPLWWLLGTLTSSVGLPFFAVAATAPLLQRWFALASGRDPYFLYAASNLGSLAGLFGYPFVIERTLTLADQRDVWLIGFAVLTLLIAGCGALVFRRGRVITNPLPALDAGARQHLVRTSDRLWWLLLAFVPSSLLLGVTTHISTDLAAVPLLWVLPLSLYLATFIVAFSSASPIWRVWTARAAPLAIAGAVAAMVTIPDWWWGLAIDLLAFTTVAMVCHRELADRRPDPAHLTQFYLLISVGGALGGFFNALAAPVIFTGVFEYPLVLLLAAFVRPSPGWRDGHPEPRALVYGVPLAVFVVLTLTWAVGLAPDLTLGRLTSVFWIGAALALAFANRVAAFAVALVLAAGAHIFVLDRGQDRTIFAARTFFGVHRVVEDSSGTYRRLFHGTTVHGSQRLGAGGRCEPGGYYHPSGPIGQVFIARADTRRAVAVIGLGAGGLACYTAPGNAWTFYEIDPVVERIARDPSLFTFLTLASGEYNVVIGDGRLRLLEAGSGTFDIVVIDAFSSDSIPVHLLTVEFVDAAMERLRPAGVLVFHISNRYLDLEPVLGAAAARLGAIAIEQYYKPTSPEASASRWLVIARNEQAIASLATDPRWRPARVGSKAWTDDFSNIFDVIVWSSKAATGVFD